MSGPGLPHGDAAGELVGGGVGIELARHHALGQAGHERMDVFTSVREHRVEAVA